MSAVSQQASDQRWIPDALRVLLCREPERVIDLLGYALRVARAALARRRQRGTYEVVAHEATIELLNEQGTRAQASRVQALRWLCNDVVAVYDTFWGDGRVAAAYSCSPGTPVDTFRDGSRHHVLISLREIHHRNHILTMHRTRKIVGGFTRANEWWETEILHKTRFVRVKIVFPRKRFCQQATITSRRSNATTPLDAQHFRLLPDGRQELTWETGNPVFGDKYVIKWRW